MPLCLQDSLRGSSLPSQGKVLQRCSPCSPLRVASATVWNGFVKLRIKQEAGCSSLLCHGTENHADTTSSDPLSCFQCSHQELADEQLSPHCFPAVCSLFPTKSHVPCFPSLRSAVPDIQTHPSNLGMPGSQFPHTRLQEHAGFEVLPRGVPFGSSSVIRLRDCPLSA